MKVKEIVEDSVVFADYPVTKYGNKFQFWTSAEGIKLVAGWRRNGLTINEICRKISVDPRTFRSWQKKFPELSEALCVSKEVSDINVTNSLYKRACGYDYQEVTQELVEGELRVTKVVKKHVPGDVKAALSWLYSRQSQLWRASQEPLDTNGPELLAAQDVLVEIRKAADGAIDTEYTVLETTNED